MSSVVSCSRFWTSRDCVLFFSLSSQPGSEAGVLSMRSQLSVEWAYDRVAQGFSSLSLSGDFWPCGHPQPSVCMNEWYNLRGRFLSMLQVRGRRRRWGGLEGVCSPSPKLSPFLERGCRLQRKALFPQDFVRFWAQAVPPWDPESIVQYRPGEGYHPFLWYRCMVPGVKRWLEETSCHCHLQVPESSFANSQRLCSWKKKSQGFLSHQKQCWWQRPGSLETDLWGPTLKKRPEERTRSTGESPSKDSQVRLGGLGGRGWGLPSQHYWV